MSNTTKTTKKQQSPQKNKSRSDFIIQKKAIANAVQALVKAKPNLLMTKTNHLEVSPHPHIESHINSDIYDKIHEHLTHKNRHPILKRVVELAKKVGGHVKRVHEFIKSPAGKLVAHHVTNALGRIFGKGNYKIHADGHIIHLNPVDKLRIKRIEYIGDVIGTVAFNNQYAQLSTGNTALWPQLAQDSAAYEMASFDQIIIQYVPTSGVVAGTSNAALGTFMVTSDPDNYDAVFSGEVDMLNFAGTEYVVPSEGLFYGVECKSSDNQTKNILTNTTIGDKSTWSMGTLQWATVGMQSAYNCGKLFVMYDVELSRKKVPSSLSNYGAFKYTNHSAEVAHAPGNDDLLGLAPTTTSDLRSRVAAGTLPTNAEISCHGGFSLTSTNSNVQDNFNITTNTYNDIVVTFPRSTVGIFEVNFYVYAFAATSFTVSPTLTFTGCVNFGQSGAGYEYNGTIYNYKTSATPSVFGVRILIQMSDSYLPKSLTISWNDANTIATNAANAINLSILPYPKELTTNFNSADYNLLSGAVAAPEVATSTMFQYPQMRPEAVHTYEQKEGVEGGWSLLPLCLPQRR